MHFSIFHFGPLLFVIEVVQISLLQAYNSKKSVSAQVTIFKNLPPDVNRIFNATISFSSFHSINSAFIVYLVNKSHIPPQKKDQFIFMPGSETKIKHPIKRQYFSIIHCVSNSIKKTLQIQMQFNRSATNLVILMFYSDNFRNGTSNNTATQVYQSNILSRNTTAVTINITIGVKNQDALYPNQFKWVNCTAFQEFEQTWQPVKLEVPNTWRILDLRMNNVTKGTSILTEFTLDHHNSMVVCRSLNQTKRRYISIYHRPTSVATRPIINARSVIPYNIPIKCLSSGGYPLPEVKWKSIVGPLNESRYYQIIENQTVLVFIKEFPPGSKWIFQCSAKNKLPPSNIDGPEILVLFNIPEFGSEARKKIFIAIPVSIILVLIVVTLLRIYCPKIFKKMKNKSSNDKNEKSQKLKNIITKYRKPVWNTPVSTEIMELSSEISSSIYSIEEGVVPIDNPVLVDFICESGSLASYEDETEKWINST